VYTVARFGLMEPLKLFTAYRFQGEPRSATLSMRYTF
jgi:hypothetical protein